RCGGPARAPGRRDRTRPPARCRPRRCSPATPWVSPPAVHHNPAMRRHLPAEADTLAAGAALAAVLEPGLVIHLSGELGAGKTTFTRGLLRGLGHTGRVKSPSFSLLEPYVFSRLYLYHFDFYRFADSKELE